MSDVLGRQTVQFDEETAAKRAIIVYNEQTKLLANALDRASTTLMSVGIIAPVASDLYGIGIKVSTDRQVAWFSIWVVCAVALHVFARRILGKMKHV